MQCDEREQVLTAFVKCYKRDAMLANKTRNAAPTTNADRIRAMSDEELANEMCNVPIRSICDIVCYGQCNAFATADKSSGDMCKEIVLAWLQQPYKEHET